MTTGLTEAAQRRAVLERDKKYDGLFYFAIKSTGIYYRPSCSTSRPLQEGFLFFNTGEQAKLQGYQACKHCQPDKLKHDLPSKILSGIDAGVINDKGVHGFAKSLHISERHLRRIVQDRTGTSPVLLNQAMRLTAARRLIIQTQLPITDVAFNAGFSSLRQFNNAYKAAFGNSPTRMRKAASLVRREQSVRSERQISVFRAPSN